MSLQTFSASTMAEALLQVKRAFGHDAVILHTRTIQRRHWMGLRKRELIEVTAGPAGAGAGRRASRDIGREQAARGQRGVAAGRSGGMGQNVGGGAMVGVGRTGQANGGALGGGGQSGLGGAGGLGAGRGGNTAMAAYARNSMPGGVKAGLNQSTPERIAAALAASSGIREKVSTGGPVLGASGNQASGGGGGKRSFFESPEMTQAMVKLVTEEVTGLRTELKELVTHVRRGGGNGSGGGNGGKGSSLPVELFEHYKQLIENQVAEELAEDILKAVKLQVPAGYLGNEAFVREKVAEQLEKLLPVAGPIKRTKATGAHVVALIGPTGVGKTTTIAKLAANLQLREGKRVGLITIDTYRIAAVDQLRRYADIIGSPLKVVGTPDEMPGAIAAMADMDYILIDSAGRSPTDSLKLSELRGFLEAAKPDEVHLVLSTTSSPKCVELAVAAFSRVRVDKLLFTKMDEAASVGVVLNIARKVGKAMSYMTTGQDVPDDIEVVKGRKLAQLILSPHGTAEMRGGDLKPFAIEKSAVERVGAAVAGGVQ